MTVGVLFIGRLGGVLEGTPDQQGAEEIEERFDSVCDQGVGTAKDTSGDLACGEEEVHEHSCQDDLAPLCCLGLDIAVAHRKKGKLKRINED